jgi:hypothetical protein
MTYSPAASGAEVVIHPRVTVQGNASWFLAAEKREISHRCEAKLLLSLATNIGERRHVSGC